MVRAAEQGDGLESKGVVVTTLQGMLWWAAFDEDGDGFGMGKPNNSFCDTLFFAMFFLLLSPLINYGTWAAAFIYAGNSNAENMHALAVMYRFNFQAFASFEWTVPAINLNPAVLVGAAKKTYDSVSELGDTSSFEPTHFMKGAQALLALNSALSYIKAAIAVSTMVLSGELMVVSLPSVRKRTGVLPNVQFSDCAKWNTDNYAEKMDALLAEATKEEQPGDAEYHIAPGQPGLQED